MHAIRITIGGALALALSGLSVVCCWQFGRHLAPGDEGMIYGALGGVADALKALLPIAIAAAVASGQRGRAAIGIVLFTVFSVYSFASELGLYALSRDAQSSSASAGRETLNQWQDERTRIRNRLKELPPARPSRTISAELSGQKQSASWTSSSECREATVAASRTYCAGLAKLEAELAAAQEAENLRTKEDALTAKIDGMDLAAVMKAADPQSEALSRLTGWPAPRIKDGLAILVALLIELGSGFALFAVTAGGAQKAGPGRLEKAEQDHSTNRPTPEEAQEDNRPAALNKVMAAGIRPAIISEPAPAEPSADPVRRFARAAIVKKAGRELPAADLHAAFARWCELEGHELLSPAALGRRLTALQFERAKRGGIVYYLNIEIAPEVRPN
jgi:hypothetical protein